MDPRDFFKFRSKLVYSWFRAPPKGLDFKRGDDWKLIKGDFSDIQFPVVFKQSGGKKMHDILDTECGNLLLISERMRNILEENQLTGWKTYPIRLYEKKDNELFGYHGFSVVGHCGSLSYEKSEIIEKTKVPGGSIVKYYKGLFFDDWDGSDFFTPEKILGFILQKKQQQF